MSKYKRMRKVEKVEERVGMDIVSFLQQEYVIVQDSEQREV